ncbi:MAG: glycosyltransferase [Burkholderiales bacterium]|nr:glycosyltransferase [Burkholderiales bacterium]
MVAFHFPPLAGSSGIQRTLRFARHLPRFGWEPLVLTAHPRAYERTSRDQLADVGPDRVVARAFALDAARHLAIGGRYPGFTARPDRWAAWWLGAVPAGIAMIRRYRPAAIWSTYPIATAHAIGSTLHRASGLPWIADFRDPMAQEGYPADPAVWTSFKRIEEAALARAACCVFVTPGALAAYRRNYPAVSPERFAIIENGYDEESFAGLDPPAADAPLTAGAVTLLHSGIVYPSERDPTQLCAALRAMLDSGTLAPGELRLRLRAPGHDGLVGRLVRENRLESVVEAAPPIPYRDALAEMMRADALLVLQAANCNEQIPAKVYEYLRARRPIIALTDPAGDTAGLLARCGVEDIARLDSAEDIALALRRFLDRLRAGRAPLPLAAEVAKASRAARAAELADLLDRMSGRPGA